jgi:hypothetical protein
MKKLFFTFLIVGFAISANAQLKIGVNASRPIGDYSDIYGFNLGADVYYMFGKADAFLKFGGATGFMNYFGSETDVVGQTVEFDDAQYIPVAGAARITLFGILTFGPDVGYAVSLNDSDASGFYWRSVLGLDFANRVEIDTYYHNITVDGTSLGTIGVALLIEFGS